MEKNKMRFNADDAGMSKGVNSGITNLIKKGCFKLKKLTVGQVEPESVKKAWLRLRKFFFVTVNSLT